MMKPLPAVLNSLKQVKGVLRSMTICYITERTWGGESFLQLVVPKARRKHVRNLCHDVIGGHIAVKLTKKRFEFTFCWPTLHDDCRNYVRTCHCAT